MNLFTMLKRGLLLSAALTLGTHTAQAQPRQYWTGDGGKGIRLAVLEPVGKGLADDEQWMLSLVQGSITGDLSKFSAMTVIDRQNLEKVLKEWEESMSGNYSDKTIVQIGNLTGASHILNGSISKTASAFMLELSVTDVTSGVRKASYSPTPVSPMALENLSAIKAASADLLRQLGVELTSAAQNELKLVANIARINAETMLARGITAQKQGTEVTALSYFYQAAAFDSSLFEASKRSSVIAANISSGNIGANVRNDILWRERWVAELKGVEDAYHGIISSVDPPYTLFYTTDIKQESINYQKRTADLSIPINLSANGDWFRAMNRSLQAVQEALNGLKSTKRTGDWGLSDWPWSGVTNTNPFGSSKQYNITLVFELANEQGLAIGSQTVRLTPSFHFNRGNGNITIAFTENDQETVTFYGVKADDISDNMTVRVASVNGAPPQNTLRFTINAISAKQRQENIFLRIEKGVVRGFNRSLSAEQKAQYRNLVIPKEAWGEPVTAIGEEAFDATYSNFKLTSVTIPEGVTSIGNSAFSNNQLNIVKFSNSVKSIGKNAFSGNQLTNLAIPKSVASIGDNAFANNQLKSVSLGNGAASIGNQAFTGDKHTATIKIPNGNAIIDTRNSQRYRTVKIGNKTWMAENLNYKTDNSWCCENNERYCNEYGRLYSGRYARLTENICPSGWHLSTIQEWKDLIDAAGGKKEAGKKLRSKKGWCGTEWDEKLAKKIEKYKGTDDFGFSALPGGKRSGYKPSGSDDYVYRFTSYLCWGYWMAAGGNDAIYMEYNTSSVKEVYGRYYIDAYSVRCVQDD
jgi:uncharacterized protein (TIGR02145 family)